MIGYNYKEPPQFKLTYTFTSDEIKILARFLRSKESELPKGLEFFTKALDDSIYSSLTLDEIKDFYS